jgi:hypothetical protein
MKKLVKGFRAPSNIKRFCAPSNKSRVVAARANPDARVTLNDDQFYTDKQVAALFNIHPVTVWVWSREGVISPPTKVGPNTSRWRGRTINQDIAKKIRGKIYV